MIKTRRSYNPHSRSFLTEEMLEQRRLDRLAIHVTHTSSGLPLWEKSPERSRSKSPTSDAKKRKKKKKHRKNEKELNGIINKETHSTGDNITPKTLQHASSEMETTITSNTTPIIASNLSDTTPLDATLHASTTATTTVTTTTTPRITSMTPLTTTLPKSTPLYVPTAKTDMTKTNMDTSYSDDDEWVEAPVVQTSNEPRSKIACNSKRNTTPSDDKTLDTVSNTSEGGTESVMIGPQQIKETTKIDERSYGEGLAMGEGAAIANFVQRGMRIPRRGEIGLTSKQIEDFESLGYVMSGSRHRRMNAVRIRKENQVYSAEEKQALSIINFEEKAAREKKIMADMRKFLKSRITTSET